MPGVVLETLSYRKLGIFSTFLIGLQVISFLVGGFIAPSPNTSEQILLSKCADKSTDMEKWYHLRPVGNGSCPQLILGDLDKNIPDGVNGDEIIFIAQFPLPRDNMSLKMSRWFQQIIAVLMLDIEYQKGFSIDDDATVTFDVRLGYKNSPDKEWKEIARSHETRPLKCVLDPLASHHQGHEHSLDGSYYDCEIIPLFTLGHVSHEQYLVNIRLPISTNRHLGKLQDIWMVEIHQNGGFTKVWLGIKTFAFPLSLLATIFFWNRITQLDRQPSLLERTIFGLGIVLCSLNLPIEWLSFQLNFPFWLVLSDIRQGAFYAALVCFWLVFTREHLMKEEIGDGASGPSPSNTNYRLLKLLQSWGIHDEYWPKLFLIIACTTSLFLFEIAERGVQVLNPFYNIWSNPIATKFGIVFMALGSVCAVIYLGYLIYLVCKALMGILGKRSVISQMPDMRRRFYTGVVYRFTILLAYTVVCAILTVIFYLFSQWNEDSWKWGNQSKIEYSSAFVTGVYGMWNVYVIAVLCLYAPSHKHLNASHTESIQNLVNVTSNIDHADTISLDSVNNVRPEGPKKTKESGFNFIQKINVN